MWVIGVLAVLAFGIAQISAGYVGIAHELGALWAVAALVAAFFLRFTLPITIGAFFGAMNVWEWHWSLAAIFAAPGLLLIVPGVLNEVLRFVKR